MEISHASVETQVAAVGINGKAEEVTVSTDAEFMMMIAHGIYSNKALALVRELLCNARDGHAKAGCLDKPIHVTLTDNLLVVRDHGTGIPNAIFAPTYMTFGKSTKRKSKAETGGFGVGTKVPWAVCDTFSARNFIEGTMTAYSIVKSDPKLEGKPSCTPIMTIPSTELSGVEVSVPFPEKMHGDINKYLVLFANELGIPLIINGSVHQPSGVDQAMLQELRSVGFTRLPNHPKTVIQQSSFYVRQGDVIYPIEEQEEFSDAWDMLNYLNAGGGQPILFQAEPDSIIPTLSRESLQYTERTSRSIRDLMKKVLQVLADNVDAYAERTKMYYPQFATGGSEFVPEMWNNKFRLDSALSRAHYAKLADENLTEGQNYLLMSNMKRWLNASTPYLETQQTNGKTFRQGIESDIDAIFAEQLKRYPYFNHERLLEVWTENKRGWNQSAMWPIKLKRDTYEEVMLWRAEIKACPDIVEVYIPKSEDFRYISSASSVTRYFLEVGELKNLDSQKENMFNSLQFMSKSLYVSRTVIFCGNLNTMLKRAAEKWENSPNERSNVLLGGGFGRLAGARCVRLKASMKPDAIQKLKALYESWGYEVITLLDPTKEELEERRRAAEERAAMKAVELPKLHELIRDNGRMGNNFSEIKLAKRKMKGLVADEKFKGEPLYFILPRGKDLPYGIKTMDDYVQLTKFVGTDIVCVSTKAEIHKVVKEGRRNIEAALVEFARWFFYRPDIYEKLFYRGTFFVKRAEQNKYLTKYLFNILPPVMTAEEKRIYDGILNLRQLFPELRQFVDQRTAFFDTCCEAEEYFKGVLDRYAHSHFCDVHRALEVAYREKPSPKRALARSILKTILKEGPA